MSHNKTRTLETKRNNYLSGWGNIVAVTQIYHLLPVGIPPENNYHPFPVSVYAVTHRLELFVCLFPLGTVRAQEMAGREVIIYLFYVSFGTFRS